MGWNPVTCATLLVMSGCTVTGRARASPLPPSDTFTSLPVGNLYHGEEPVYRSSLDDWSNAMYIVDPSDPIRQAAKIVRWEYYARRNGATSLLVFRKANEKKRYRLVSKSSYTSGRGFNKFRPNGSITVERGDLLGFYFPGQSIIPYDGFECLTNRTLYVKSPSHVTEGSSYDFSTKHTGWDPCRKYSVRAQLVTDSIPKRTTVLIAVQRTTRPNFSTTFSIEEGSTIPAIDSNPKRTTVLRAVQTTNRPNFSTTFSNEQGGTIPASSPKGTLNIKSTIRSSTGSPQPVVGIPIMFVMLAGLIL